MNVRTYERENCSSVLQFFSPSVRSGFTLIELLVTIGVLGSIVLAMVGMTTAFFRVTTDARFQEIALAIVNERIEIARILPYGDVGTTTGIPRGKLTATEKITRSGLSIVLTTSIRNVDDPFDGTIGGSPKDTAPADYKKVEMIAMCTSCRSRTHPVTLSTIIAPKSLEVSSGNGALFIRVLDAVGGPVPGATVHIENQKLTPNLVIDDVTDNQGMLQLIDIPPSTGGYHTRVTKTGYSMDATYPPGNSENPNPEKTDSTVLKETVTEANFFIDRVSTLNMSAINDRCIPAPGVRGTLTGTKLIGKDPETLKYPAKTFTTSASGEIAMTNLEWDTYTLALTDTNSSLAGAIPETTITIPPGAAQDAALIVDPISNRNLLVTVMDAITGLPLPGAVVTLEKGSATYTRETGKGFVIQTDWSGGSGQTTFTDDTRYASDSGTLDMMGSAGDVLLKKVNKEYLPDGILESSTIDFGSTVEYVALRMSPGDQPPATGAASVRLQIATNNDGTTWNFVGPNGTGNSFFTTTDTTIPNRHNGQRYFRYRLFLHTDDSGVSPSVAEVQIVFASQCIPPGQVFFRALSDGQHTLTVTKPGYATLEEQVQVTGQTNKNIILSP